VIYLFLKMECQNSAVIGRLLLKYEHKSAVRKAAY